MVEVREISADIVDAKVHQTLRRASIVNVHDIIVFHRIKRRDCAIRNLQDRGDELSLALKNNFKKAANINDETYLRYD